MNKFLFALLTLLSVPVTIAQRTSYELDTALNEVSGIAPYTDTSFLVLNDGGNESILFEVSEKGSIVNSFFLPIENVDWEALAIDDSHVYIGDFGNNNNSRKNLKVYRISLTSLKTNHPDVDSLCFSYAFQEHYPPKETKRFFDAEAMYLTSDSLFIISKNRSTNDNFVYGVSLSNWGGPSIALRPLTRIIFSTGNKSRSYVTDCCFYQGELYLLRYDGVYVVRNDRAKKVLNIPLGQWEGLSIKNAKMYIVSEFTDYHGFVFKAKLLVVDLKLE